MMAAIQSRFEVAVPELPDHIDPASYSTFDIISCRRIVLTYVCSDFLNLVLSMSC